MHPDLFFINKGDKHGKKSNRKDGRGDWLTDICVTLTGGNILERDRIVWGFTFEEIQPFLDYKVRDMVFRESVLGFLGVTTQKDIEDEYCEACRAAKKDNCATCTRDIVREKTKGEKVIGN